MTITASQNGASGTAEPKEAVTSINWTGHRLLYLEAVLIEAAKQGRPHLVIVDERALSAPEWGRVDDVLEGHSLRTVNFDRTDLAAALPASIERVIALEADSLMTHFMAMLRGRPHLHASLQLMREPTLHLAREPEERHANSGQGARAFASSGAKTALIGALGIMFGSRCQIHVLRSPLFPPTSVTRALASRGWCTTIVDPVLGPQRSAAPTNIKPSTTPPIALVTGQLNARKSLGSLLETWPDPALGPYRLMLRGRISDDTKVHQLVEQAHRRGADVDLDDRYLSDDALNQVMQEASAVLCLHQSDVPSGVAALAVQAGCPVVAFSHTQLGKALAANGLGCAIDSIDGTQLAQAIETCTTLSRTAIRETAASMHAHATVELFSQQLLDGDSQSGSAAGVTPQVATGLPTTDRQFFFTAKAQYENVGDLIINRLVLRELQKYGTVHVNRSGAPDAYLGALGMTAETSTRWWGRSPWFLRLVTSAAQGKAPLLVFRPGGDRISESVTNLERAKAQLFSQLSRAGIIQAKYGASFHGQKSLHGGRIKHLDSLLVRDRDSLRDCVESSQRYVGLVPDVACLLPFDPELGGRNLDRERTLLSICLRSIENGFAAWEGAEDLTQLARILGLEPVVVSQVQLDEPTSALAAERLSLPITRWRGDLTTLLQILTVYEKSQFTVTSRLHAALLAALCGSCPIVIETPKGKSRKVAACFEYLELGDLVVGSMTEAVALTQKLADDGLPPQVATGLGQLVDGTVGGQVSEAIANDLSRLLADAPD